MKEHIHQSNLIENIDDLGFDEQSMYAWNYLKDVKKLTEKDVRTVQKMITLLQKDMQPHWRGYYRDVSGQEVFIGGRQAPAAQMTPHLMKNWLLDYRGKMPKQSHIDFEYIHPFVDGNGRTGRMLMWWHEMQLGKEPTLIKFDERQEYYGWF